MEQVCFITAWSLYRYGIDWIEWLRSWVASWYQEIHVVVGHKVIPVMNKEVYA